MKAKSRSSHDELSHLLNYRVIKKFQKDILDKLGIYILIIDRKGSSVISSSVKIDANWRLLIKRCMTEMDFNTLRANAEHCLLPGIKLLLYPLSFKKGIKGLIIAGPILEKKPDRVMIQELSDRYDIDAGELAHLLEKMKVLDGDREEIARTFIENSIELIRDNIAEHLNYSKHIQDISSVYKVVKSLNTTLSLKEVLARVLDYSIEILDARKGTVMLLDEEEQVMKSIATSGFNEESTLQKMIKSGTGAAGKVAETGMPILALKGQKEGEPGAEYYEQRSALCVPLKVMDKITGLIYITAPRNNRDFTLAELEILEVIGSSAAVAINNARLYEDICKKVQEHATLLYVANAISSSLNPDKVLQEVLDKAIRLLDAQKGSLMLIDDDTKELRIVNACGLSDDIILNTRIRVGEGISGRVASEGEPILLQKGVRVANSHSDKDTKELDSAISVPVRIKDKVIGVVNVRDQASGGNFKQEHMALLQMLASQAAIAIENARLHRELKDLFVGSVKALINAIEARDKYTSGHSIRVTHYSLKIAQALNMEAEDIENLQYAALLHDIGKINIKDEILLKPGNLTAEEREKIQEHPSLGATIMQPVKAFQRILPFLYCHHERFDGSGYSQKLKGADIPIESRIIAVADSFDAMTSDRPYRKALTTGDAISELRKNSGTQFDPLVVSVFVDIVKNDRTCSPRCINDTPLV